MEGDCTCVGGRVLWEIFAPVAELCCELQLLFSKVFQLKNVVRTSWSDGNILYLDSDDLSICQSSLK